MEHSRINSDATVLIGLARINRLSILALLNTPIYVTLQVWNESANNPEKPGVTALREARDKGLLVVVDEGDPGAFPQLDAGESTVLSAAVAHRATVLIDERRARALIRDRSELRSAIPHVTGVLGLILLAKDRGHITAVRPLLDELLHVGFRLSPSLYRTVIERAGEQ